MAIVRLFEPFALDKSADQRIESVNSFTYREQSHGVFHLPPERSDCLMLADWSCEPRNNHPVKYTDLLFLSANMVNFEKSTIR